MSHIPVECSELLDIMHVCEEAHHRASEKGGRACFNARKQYVMTEENFERMAATFVIALDGLIERRPESVYTREKKAELEYVFQFDYVRLKLTYDRQLGGAFCVVEDTWAELDAAYEKAQAAMKKMLGTTNSGE